MSDALSELLAGLVDYAGLFPPASLPMTEAVRHYAGHRVSARRTMLARFVIPAARLDEFLGVARGARSIGDDTPWPLAVLAAASDAAALEEFDTVHGTLARVDMVEARASDVATIEALAIAYPERPVFVEIPVHEDPDPLIAALAKHELHAKIRTGGVTADAFPTPAQVMRFLERCLQHHVPFKATAGLHHPLRGEYPLSYDDGSAQGTMYGFLNVFIAALLLRAGHPAEQVAPLLEERDAASISFTPERIAWRGLAVDATAVSVARAQYAGGFGSCSFEEPVRALEGLSILTSPR